MVLLKVSVVNVIKHTSVGRTGSYASLASSQGYDSFQHFNSKLLANVNPGKFRLDINLKNLYILTFFCW